MGRDGKLPWKIPEDAKHFDRLTAGNICVMGRICFDTWPAAARDGRYPVVLTSHPVAHRLGDTSKPIQASSLPEALATAETLPGELFICGGQQIFEETLTLNRPMRLHLTLVHAEIAGDRTFPEWRHLSWREIERRDSADPHYRYTFLTLERER